MLHGCRQLVSRDVGLSPATSATPFFSYHHLVGDSKDTAPVNGEEGGDDVKSSWPYVQGYTRATMGCTKGCQPARVSQSQKAVRSSDWSLQLDFMKLESLVIVDQHATVNTFPGLVHTARHTMRVGCTRSRWANPSGMQAPKV